ncbi:TetR family transcriptional regulator [Streptomyces sp. TG1A-8]|uniref:TetR family transcriptional regulator n=1 Tax=Streptomyces sp. TG1A-8 TaxID=3051385 RepID=UPI00265C12C6|nr:TetR family transcriptional regulator [Streptomyces sp. TG1A-8]MDO0924403.1 TetR family transcriptional regulator [Streptomyces sp. TG1A-8]
MAKAAQANARTFTQKARRAQIIEAAIETLAEAGYAKATFSRISQQAELCSTGLISYHFSGKPELLREAARTIVAQAESVAGSRIGTERTYRGKLNAYIAASFEFVVRYPVHTRALTEIVAMIRDRRITGLDEVEHTLMSVDRLASLLERGRRAGEFGTFDSLAMALAIRGAIDNVLCHHFRTAEVDLNHCARELTTMFDRCTRPA